MRGGDEPVGGEQVEREVVERPAPRAAEGRTNDRFVPLPQVAVLVERAVGARRGRVGADVGERVRATGEARRAAHGIAVVEAVGDAVIVEVVHRGGDRPPAGRSPGYCRCRWRSRSRRPPCRPRRRGRPPCTTRLRSGSRSLASAERTSFKPLPIV